MGGVNVTFSNTIVFDEAWTTKLQERLAEPTKFKDICRVEYTDSKVLHNPYLTEITVQTLYRGSSYTPQSITITDESVTINTHQVAPVFIERSDLAFSTYLSQMDQADRQGVLLNEAIDSAVYGDYASMTSFDNTQIGGSAGNITVSDTNIDDIITAVTREISEANGDSLLDRNGGFFVWRPADFEYLQRFCMANGFSTADNALKGGVKGGFDYMGFTHYKSNRLTAGHVVAGVKKVYHLGICRGTYGQIVITTHPMNVSGIGIVSRVDYKGKVWANIKPVLFNITVV